MKKIEFIREIYPTSNLAVTPVPASQLVATGEGRWQSVGHDPYFEIGGPFESGWYRATWRMGAAAPLPATFFVQFGPPHRSLVVVHCASGKPGEYGQRHHLFRFGYPVRRILLQPMVHPGEFEFGEFTLVKEDEPQPQVLYAMNDLIPIEYGWRSLGEDPAFECEWALPSGHYRFRWSASADFRLQFKLYFGADGRFSEQNMIGISGGNLRVGSDYSFIAHVPEGTTHVQLHPCECTGIFQLFDFSVESVSAPTVGQFYPRRQIEKVHSVHLNEETHEFRSLGVDPAFELETELMPGLYDITWVASASFPFDARIYFGRGTDGFSELAAVSWSPRLCKDEKRFRVRIRLEESFDRIQFHPTPDRTGNFTFRDLKIEVLGSIRNWLLDMDARTISTTVVQRHWFTDYVLDEETWKAAASESARWHNRPLVSVLMPVFNPHQRYLREAIESVLQQAYDRWELCIVDDASTTTGLRELLLEYSLRDERIRVFFREKNGHIAATTNVALEQAQGNFVAFLDQDDCLHPKALHDVVKMLQARPNLDLIYTDEDKVDALGRHIHPIFKPDWSPDTLLAKMYMGHLLVFRRDLVMGLGGLREAFSGSQDYDLVLRAVERTKAIAHVPKVRYHWRAHPGSVAGNSDAKPYAFELARGALQEALARRGELGTVRAVAAYPGNYEIVPDANVTPFVSIIVPFRDHFDVTSRCLESVLERSTYRNFELILVDNESNADDMALFRSEWEKRSPERVRFISWPKPFNFSELNNAAVKTARGELILFLNNDTVVISNDWIERMVGQAIRPGIGAVGAKLLYEDHTVQHAGVLLGVGGVAAHSHRHLHRDDPGYFVGLHTLTNYAAVTGACLMCQKAIFDEVGGFDPKLAIAFNDVDLCLRFLKAGYRNVFVPVELFHLESKTRGYEDSPQKQLRFEGESRLLSRRWKAIIGSDPYFSPHFSRLREDFNYDLLPADSATVGHVVLNLDRRIVMHPAIARRVSGRCSFRSGKGPSEGWFFLDGHEVGPLDLLNASRDVADSDANAFELQFPELMSEGAHQLDVLVKSVTGERAGFSCTVDVTVIPVEGDDAQQLSAIRRIVPFDLPTQTYVEVTTACNLACIMCRFDVKGKDVATNLFLQREVFERIAPHFEASRVVHLYGWGEPTLHRNYVDFIRTVRSRSRECRIVFTSNFTNISERLMAVFIEERVDMINVSIDGASADVYEHIRRQGSFDRLLENLETFRQMKDRYRSPLPMLQYECVVQRANVHELPEIVDLVYSLGAGTLTIEHVSDMPHLEIDYLEWLPTFVKAEQRALTVGIGLVGSAATRFREAAHKVSESKVRVGEPSPVICFEPFQTIYVNPNGTITPCCMSSTVLGDLRKNSLEEIWFGRTYNNFRERLISGDLEPRCQTCVNEGKTQRRLVL